MFGSNAKRQSLQVSFHAEVGSLYGLRRAPPRLSGAAKQAGVAQVLDKLTANDDPVLVSAVWATTCDAIARYPDPFMQALGITPQTKPQRSFEQIALSTGKGPKTAVGAASRDRRLMTGATSAEPIHIGFQPDCEDRNLSSVGIAQYLPALPLPTGWPEADAAHHAQVLAQSLPQGGAMAASPPNCPYEHIRERDSDRESGDWDTETGEFVDRCPPPTPWIKAAAREVVEAAV